MARLARRESGRPSAVRTATRFNQLVDEIVEVLLEYGGSAHRDAVIMRVAVRRGAADVSDLLRREILQAFDMHLGGGDSRRSLLQLPFGVGSHRWAVTSFARAMADERRQADAAVGMALAFQAEAALG